MIDTSQGGSYDSEKDVRIQLNMARIRKLDKWDKLASKLLASIRTTEATDRLGLVYVDESILNEMRDMVQPPSGTYKCPQCGKNTPHTH